MKSSEANLTKVEFGRPVPLNKDRLYYENRLTAPSDIQKIRSTGTVKKLRDIVPNAEEYAKYEPFWSDLRMLDGNVPLPKNYQLFKDMMGWTDEA